jgi:hypothetical protein
MTGMLTHQMTIAEPDTGNVERALHGSGAQTDREGHGQASPPVD